MVFLATSKTSSEVRTSGKVAQNHRLPGHYPECSQPNWLALLLGQTVDRSSTTLTTDVHVGIGFAYCNGDLQSIGAYFDAQGTKESES